MSEYMIDVENLHKSYGQVKAVKGISFHVKKGELFAFLGENGAGKSTTINIISGITGKDSGTVIVNGINIEKEPMQVKSSIGIVFQNSVLDKKLTVYDNLKIKATLYGLGEEEFKRRLYEINGLLDLNAILKRPLEKLSGGQRRKADIARALLHEPELLILDEPTTGLDPQTRKTVWESLEKLRKETGLTIFLTTHYMEEAAEADYVVILNEGAIVAKGTPHDLKSTYANDLIRIYGQNPAVLDMVQKEGLSHNDKENHIELEVPHVSYAKELIVKYPNLFDDFEIVKGKMDDVFLKATGKRLEEDEKNA